jgi:rhodanese-related sulfurtransferase
MLTLLLALTLQAASADADVRMPFDQFQKLYDARKVLVVDVRGEQAYRQGHIPGAIWIPTNAVSSKLADLKDEKRPIVTYCS